MVHPMLCGALMTMLRCSFLLAFYIVLNPDALGAGQCQVLTPPSVAWQHTYGGSGSRSLMSIREHPDGGYVLGGTAAAGPYGYADYWVVRVDRNGSAVWDRYYGGMSNDLLMSIEVTGNGDIILGGSSDSAASGNKSGAPLGGADFWIVRLNADGTPIWDRTYGSSGDDMLASLAVTPDGAIVAYGDTRGPADHDVTGPLWGGASDLWVLRLALDGTKVWDRIHGTRKFERAFRYVRVLGDSSIVFSAETEGQVIDEQTSPGYVWVVRLNSEGSILWDRGVQGAYLNGALAGVTDQGVALASLNLAGSGVGGDEFAILRLSKQGSNVWQSVWGGSGNEFPTALTQTSDGGFIVAGMSGSPGDGTKCTAKIGSFDGWLVRLDRNGQKLWDLTLGYPNRVVHWNDVIQTSDGGFLVGGYIEDPNSQFWAIKLGPDLPHLSLVPDSQPPRSQDSFVFQVTGPTNRYILEHSFDDGPWIPFQTNDLTAGPLVIVDEQSPERGKAVYRARISLPEFQTNQPIKILLQPEPVTVLEGTDVRMEVVAEGTPPLDFKWYYNRTVEIGAASILDLPRARQSQSGIYSATIANMAGTAATDPVGLTVLAASPFILTQPESREIGAGAKVRFDVDARGTPPLAYQWFHDEEPITDATNRFLSIANAQGVDGGIYRVTISNALGGTNGGPAMLVVTTAPPTIVLDSPLVRAVRGGWPLTLRSIATGTDPKYFQWFQDGTALPEQTNAFLQFDSAGTNHTGSYHLLLSNELGTAVSSNLSLTVLPKPAIPYDWPLPELRLVVGGLIQPIHVSGAGNDDPRLFVVERSGLIYIVKDGVLLETPFLDITNKVWADSYEVERGAFSVAFPPEANARNHCYVNYTRWSDGATIVARYRISENPDLAVAESEEILLEIPQTYGNHNGGQLTFGPDGFLYIGTGDGGSEGDPDNNAQNPLSLLGKLLRIDVTGVGSGYAIPPNNPFLGDDRYLPEIWAMGLRNPWSVTFDPIFHDMYVADVGQYLIEEIDFQAAYSDGGQNYGWRIKEGSSDYIRPENFDASSLTAPIAEYGHADGRCIIGGRVYWGPGSDRMRGTYFFADFVQPSLWGLKNDGDGWRIAKLVNVSQILTSFGVDQNGRLYAIDTSGGKLFEIFDSGRTFAPAIEPAGGNFQSHVEVTFTCQTPGAKIHYAMGRFTTPTPEDPWVLSGESITITSSLTLNAMAYRPDLTPSELQSATYFIY
jgi:Glucose / Sorbosone dehydrogenase/Immunoglobulin I-set domain/Chitobiase/beta-hexosaminidase C-terminal domain